jgi:hypothetical protein
MIERRARELSVRHVDTELGHQFVDPLHVVLARLMAHAARARVDHHADLSLGEVHGLGRFLIPDLVDHLHLEEVVAGAQTPQLRGSTFLRPFRDPVGTGVGERAEVLAVLGVLFPSDAFRKRELHSLREDLVDLGPRQLHAALPADAPGDSIAQRLD